MDNQDNEYMQFVPSASPSPSPSPSMDSDNEYMQFMPTNKPEAHENFLQKAIKQGGSFFRGMRDVESGGMNKLGNMAGDAFSNKFISPHFSPEVNAKADKMVNSVMQEPENEPVAYGVGGAIPIAHAVGSIGKGIGKFFSKGDLPEKIEMTKNSIRNIVEEGPSKVKSQVGKIFDEFQTEFGNRIKNIKGGITNNHLAEALDKTAQDIGAHHISGSPGNKASQLAEHFKGMSTANADRFFTPDEIQAQAKQILNSFGKDTMAKAKFYNNFTDVLSREVPELANLKSEYAPVYDIAKESKVINSGNLRKVSNGNIGSERFGRMAQAQQMMNDSPNVVEEADALGRTLSEQKGQLNKILERQRTAKDIAKKAGIGIGIEEIIRNLMNKQR